MIKINNCFFSWRTNFNEISIGGVKPREKGWNKVCLTLVLMILRFSPKKSWLLLSWTTAGKKHMHSCKHVCIHALMWWNVFNETMYWNWYVHGCRGVSKRGKWGGINPPQYTIDSSSAHPEPKPLDYIYSLKATTAKDYTFNVLHVLYLSTFMLCCFLLSLHYNVDANNILCSPQYLF